jgi:hypothetical protein
MTITPEFILTAFLVLCIFTLAIVAQGDISKDEKRKR